MGKIQLRELVVANEHMIDCESCQDDLRDIGYRVPIKIILNWDMDTLDKVQEFTYSFLYTDNTVNIPSILNGYEYINVIDELSQALDKEVEWCNSDEAKGIDKSQEFKDGFLAGLNQAIIFVNKINGKDN